MSGIKVIVADDSLTARMFTSRCLEVLGLAELEVREAVNGKKVLELLEQSSCDLIILDINMPEMDGKEVLQALKASEAYKEVPVIIVSSISNPENDKQLIDMGAHTVIKKPVAPAKFMGPIKELNLKKEESADGW